MRKFMCLFVICCLVPLTVNAEFSRGIRFGVITKASVSGYFKKSLECDMLLGVDSSPFQLQKTTKTKNGGTKVNITVINPWKFSGDVIYNDVINELAGELTYVEYNQEYLNTGLVYNTDYKILNISRIIDPLPVKSMFDENYTATSKSDGFRIGYIVKASEKGALLSSWEITIQEGSSGNKFIDMSVNDKKLYEFIYNCVKSGSKVKVIYKDMGILNTNITNDTSYIVIGVIKL